MEGHADEDGLGYTKVEDGLFVLDVGALAHLGDDVGAHHLEEMALTDHGDEVLIDQSHVVQPGEAGRGGASKLGLDVMHRRLPIHAPNAHIHKFRIDLQVNPVHLVLRTPGTVVRGSFLFGLFCEIVCCYLPERAHGNKSAQSQIDVLGFVAITKTTRNFRVYLQSHTHL